MKTRLLLAGLLALPFIACDDETNSNEDPIQIPDSTPDPEPDPDAAPEPEPDAAIEPDMMEPDAGPEFPGGPVIDAPEALIYLNDPTTDEGMLTRVVLDPVTSDDGRLTSEWVEVFNCLTASSTCPRSNDLRPKTHCHHWAHKRRARHACPAGDRRRRRRVIPAGPPPDMWDRQRGAEAAWSQPSGRLTRFVADTSSLLGQSQDTVSNRSVRHQPPVGDP